MFLITTSHSVLDLLVIYEGGDFYQFRTKMALKSLEKYAKEMGLDPGQITSLVATAGSGRLGT